MTTAPRKLSRVFSDDVPVIIMRDFAQDPVLAHSHPWMELVIIVAGGGVHTTEGGEYPIVAGDVFVISGDRSHGYHATRGLVLTNVLFHPERMGLPSMDVGSLSGYHALFTLEPRYRDRHRFESRLRLGTQQLAHVRSLVATLDDELRAQEPGYRFMARSVLMQLIGYLSRCYSREQAPEAASLLRIGETISYIEENYAQPITLAELQDVAHMSKSGLLRAFRQALDSSPIDYLIRLRISRAAELLSQGDLSVTEVAFRVGFSDSNYFARQFRKVMGESAREYRSGQRRA